MGGNKVKAVIFDMDGVLVNTEPLHFRCWRAIFAKDGIDLDYDVYKQCIGSTMTYLLELIRINYGKTFPDKQEVFDRMAAKKDEIIAKEGYPKLPGLTTMVHALHEAGYLLAVASSSPMHHIDQAIAELGLEECFDVRISGENVTHPKPAPDTFLTAADALGVEPSECLVVEDSTNGGKAAKAAGMPCVWFHNPDSGEQSIPQAVWETDSWAGEGTTETMFRLLKELG